MSKIEAGEFNIRDILKERYSIEYYQREYRWEEKHITDLLEDLTEKFLNSEGKEHYFLGSIIINKENQQQQFIIDGQQRLTSLTLLLIYICRTLKDQNALKEEIDELIYSKGEGFNLNVAPRNECMEALRRRGVFAPDGAPESIKNIVECYKNIETFFQDNHAGDTSTPSDELELPKFAEWLIKKVYLVRITANSSTDAYAIFETLNARGLSLTPTEMLKGYLLTNGPKDKEIRSDLNKTWKELVNDLQSIGKGEEADAIKAWLRSQYAQDTRPHKKDAEPHDFERIGTEFHRWVPDNLERLGIDKEEENDFADFISRDFSFYGRRYKFIRDAAIDFNFAKDNKVEAIHYNAYNNFTLQRTVLLAPLKKEELDDEPTVLRKLQIVSSFLDILIARRIWNYKSTAYSTMRYNMFLLIKEIRGESIDGLIDILTRYLEKEMRETFDSLEPFGLRRNTPRVRYLLARMTDYVETQSGGGESRFPAYIRPDLHEVEHIWAKKKYKEHGYDDEPEYLEHRNRIGGLLLLPPPRNRDFGSLPYDEKLQNYGEGRNLLVQSLHEGAYRRNKRFRDFNDEFKRNSGLEFRHHPNFRKDDLNERQELYRELCKQIWDPEKLRGM